jgi:hypothetical protein
VLFPLSLSEAEERQRNDVEARRSYRVCASLRIPSY